MKKFMKELVRSFRGVFLPKAESESSWVKDINESLKSLEYYGIEYDKKNMKEDFNSFNDDFKKSVKESKKHFELSM